MWRPDCRGSLRDPKLIAEQSATLRGLTPPGSSESPQPPAPAPQPLKNVLALDRKLFRDLAQLKGQSIAIALVIGAGVATFVNSQTMLRSLESTREAFYERYHFADVFASVKRAPNSLVERIREVPGVARVETRIVEGVTLDVPTLEAPAFGQLISLPDTRPPLLNQVFLRRGRMLEPGRDDEVLASEKFVEANRLDVGDSVVAIINGNRQELRIVGVVLAPEYVLQVKPGDVVPDPKHYAVLWMNHLALSRAYNMESAFNDLAIELLRGASEAEVIFRIDELIDPYGGRGAYGRKDQLSHLLLEGDIQGLKTTGLIPPVIFLSVAAFLLNVVLTRMLALQREQIAALKAFGYTNLDIGWHYMKFVLIVTLAGVSVGVLAGAIIARDFTAMIAAVYQYPELLFRVRWDVAALAAGAALVAAMLGAIGAVRKAVRLPPAEAMRPEPPASFRPTIVERLGIGHYLPNVARMVLRQLERQPIKTGLSIFAIGLSVGIVVVGSFMQDTIDTLMDVQFRRVQRYDMLVQAVEPLSSDIRYALESIDGVEYVETFRSVPARLRMAHRSRRVALQGLPLESDLYQLVDKQGAVRQPPVAGVVLSLKLAELLEVAVGDMVVAEVLEAKRPTLELPVVATIDDMQGLNAYMNFADLSRAMGEGPRASGAYLRIDPAARSRVYRELKEIPALAGVTVKDFAIESFESTIAQNLLKMRLFNLSFSIVIAVGVVYNSARIALSERSRELATLRVVGFTRSEISGILLGELGTMTLLAIPLGMGIGYGLAWTLVQFLDQEVFRFPFAISARSFGLAVSVVLTAAIISSLLVRQRLDHLDLVSVLKSRE